MAKFKIGQAVVGVGYSGKLSEQEVRAIEIASKNGITFPKQDKIYHVRSYTTSGDGIRLVEIINPAVDTTNGFQEQGFYEDNFEPVIETKSHFREVTFEKVYKELNSPITAS